MPPSSSFMPGDSSPMSANPPHPPHVSTHTKRPMHYQQHQHLQLPATPLTPSHSSSAEADAEAAVSDGGGPNEHNQSDSIPQSVKGAPEHLRPVIRKRQNSESAKRSRQRRKVAAKAFYERFDDQCKRLAALEHKVAALSDLVRKKREMEAAEARRQAQQQQHGHVATAQPQQQQHHAQQQQQQQNAAAAAAAAAAAHQQQQRHTQQAQTTPSSTASLPTAHTQQQHRIVAHTTTNAAHRAMPSAMPQHALAQQHQQQQTMQTAAVSAPQNLSTTMQQQHAQNQPAMAAAAAAAAAMHNARVRIPTPTTMDMSTVMGGHGAPNAPQSVSTKSSDPRSMAPGMCLTAATTTNRHNHNGLAAAAASRLGTMTTTSGSTTIGGGSANGASVAAAVGAAQGGTAGSTMDGSPGSVMGLHFQTASTSTQAAARAQLDHLQQQLRHQLQLQQQMQGGDMGSEASVAHEHTVAECPSEHDTLLPTDDCRVGGVSVGQAPLVEPVLQTMAAAVAAVPPAGGVGVADDSHPLPLDDDLTELLEVQSNLLFSPC